MKMGKIEKSFVNRERHAQRTLEEVERLLSKIDLGSANRVLEIGCGVGAISTHLANKYKLKVTGTDVDPEQIEVARERNQENDNLTFVEADATSLQFGDREFDMVLMQNVMHHIGDWGKALAEITRVLKPKGFFVFSDLAYARLVEKILGPLVKKYGIYSIDDIASFLRRNDFQLIYEEKSRGVMMRKYSVVAQEK